MAVPSIRLFDGSVMRPPLQFCQFKNYVYVRDEDGNEVLSTNPSSSSSGTTTQDVRLATGADRFGLVK